MIEIKNLHKWFNRFKSNKLHVINNVSLKLPNKGLIALLGPSGSGKTTMLNLIGGLDKQTKGKVVVNGKSLSKRCNLKRDYVRTLHIGYIFQDYKLIENESVYDNVALSLKLLGVKNKKEIKRRVEYILEQVDMLRYRYRPASMLSGGERQRVGIARALVKDPDIILADEPTGNLDSKNTLDVMNIISRIAKDKLVVLVTHEQNLAKFYADRIIEFSDGVITNDYKNEHPDDLDYQVENKFYLQDFKHKSKLNDKNSEINIYSNTPEDIKIDIVVKNGNYYIKTYNNFMTRVVDDDSSIEFIDGKYKKINKSELENVSFDAEDIKRKRYSSIFNIFSFFSKGFQKVFNYSLLKKILLGGFLISGGFIMYAASSYIAATTIKDEQFITSSRDYITIVSGKNKVNKYNEIANINSNAFLVPGDANASLKIENDLLFEFRYAELSLSGNLVSLESVSKEDLIYGRMPENEYEIVVDKLTIDNAYDVSNQFKMVGYVKTDDLLNKNLVLDDNTKFKIVGITNKVEPSIFISKNYIYPVLLSTVYENDYTEEVIINSYSTNKDNLKIVRGKAPVNDYEVIVNFEERYDKPLNRKLDYKINGNKVTVVGYYTPNIKTNDYFVNDNTLLYKLITKTKNISVYKENINTYKKIEYQVRDNYTYDKNVYKSQNSKNVRSKMIVSLIIVSISLVEVFLISRSSFLSKVKEVGTYRAIGVKRRDICKMFMGEAFAITTVASVPGILFSGYLLNKLSELSIFKYTFIVNMKVFIVSIIIVYIFNIVVSLLPVLNLIRKTPANILSRNDVD